MNTPMRQPSSGGPDQGPIVRPFVDAPINDESDRSETQAALASPDSDLLSRKLARLREFVEQALAESDPRLSALGIAEEALLRMLVRIDSMAERVLADPAPDVHICTELQMLTVELLRCAALAQRFAHLRLAFSELLQSLPEPRGLVER